MPEQRSSESEKGNLPRPRALLQLIQFIASESSQVILTQHAMDRMDERDITTKMIFDVLRKGTLCGGVEEAKAKGDFKAKLTYQVPNRRHVGVVTVVKQSEKLIIVTVEWEDGK